MAKKKNAHVSGGGISKPPEPDEAEHDPVGGERDHVQQKDETEQNEEDGWEKNLHGLLLVRVLRSTSMTEGK